MEANASQHEHEVNSETYQLAVKMLHEGKSEAQIRARLTQEGLTEPESNEVIKNITKFHKKHKKEQGDKNMLYGGLWFVGGLVATFATEGMVLFYGAIIAGLIQFFIGVNQSSSS